MVDFSTGSCSIQLSFTSFFGWQLLRQRSDHHSDCSHAFFLTGARTHQIQSGEKQFKVFLVLRPVAYAGFSKGGGGVGGVAGNSEILRMMKDGNENFSSPFFVPKIR